MEGEGGYNSQRKDKGKSDFWQDNKTREQVAQERLAFLERSINRNRRNRVEEEDNKRKEEEEKRKANKK